MALAFLNCSFVGQPLINTVSTFCIGRRHDCTILRPCMYSCSPWPWSASVPTSRIFTGADEEGGFDGSAAAQDAATRIPINRPRLICTLDINFIPVLRFLHFCVRPNPAQTPRPHRETC